MYVCVCVWCLLGLLERKYMYSTVREGNSHLAMNYVFCRGGSRIQFVVCWHGRVESNESENADFGSNESDRLPRVASIDRGRYMSGRLLDILCSPMSRISDFKSKHIFEYCPQIPVSCADVLWTTGPPPLALPDNDTNHEHSALRQSKESENLRFTHTHTHYLYIVAKNSGCFCFYLPNNMWLLRSTRPSSSFFTASVIASVVVLFVADVAKASNPFSSNVVALTSKNWKEEVLDYPHGVFINICRQG